MNETREVVTGEVGVGPVASPSERSDNAEQKLKPTGKGGAKKLPMLQGSSITLWGSGDRSGKDIDNSMSLGDFYGRFVMEREDGEG